MLKSELEKLKQEKESNQLKIEIFDNASKSLDKLIGNQITDKSRKGVGFVSYNAIPPPLTGLFSPPKFDLSNSGLEEFQQPEFEGYGPKTSKSVSKDISKEVRESPDAPLVKELVLDDKLTAITIKGKGWNMVPRAILMKTGLRSHNTVRPVTTAHLKTIVYSARTMQKAVNTARPNSAVVNAVRANQVNAVKGHLQKEDHDYVNSGCSGHMTGNMSYLLDFKEFDKGYVTFGGGAKGGKITGKGTLKTGKLDFEDVYFVKELQFNLFSVSQMCDKKNSVLFTDTGCFVLSPDFKLADESQVLLKVPRKNNMYSVDMKNIVPKESLTCLVAKATLDESMLWHRRLGHVNFKTINKLVKENLVRGLPSKRFENDQTCVACLKGKQHKASCKFDRKSDEGFFVGYLLNSKAFRVYNIRTRKVEESLHIRFLEDKPIIVGIEESIVAGHYSKETGSSQDCILMPLWKDGSLFDSSSNNEIMLHVKLHMLISLVIKQVDMSNITTTYLVHSTPNTRIHKDHSLDHVIGDVQSDVQT
ncbi:ribonuclease H-like domain-containing protein, partial [Tanacetum coccineum]